MVVWIERRGFTLLEMLIVIAIVGVLASVVVMEIGRSKHKGADAAIQSALQQAASQAEVYYNSNGRSYSGVCDIDGDPNKIGRFLVAAQQTYGGPVNTPYLNGTAGSFGPPVVEVCHDEDQGYAAWVPLVYQSASAFCIDGYNNVRLTNNVLPADSVTCPP